MVDLAQMAKGIGLGVWGAIETFQTLASASRPSCPVSADCVRCADVERRTRGLRPGYDTSPLHWIVI
jgi:hypothetical protein